MSLDKRKKTIENLAMAATLGFIALVVAVISLIGDSRAMADERLALAPSSAIVVVAGRADDPCFDRIYRIQADTGVSYATVITFRSPSGAALIGAWYTQKGELQELRLLGSCSSRLPSTIRELLANFPGAEAVVGRAAEFARRSAGVATEGRS